MPKPIAYLAITFVVLAALATCGGPAQIEDVEVLAPPASPSATPAATIPRATTRPAASPRTDLTPVYPAGWPATLTATSPSLTPGTAPTARPTVSSSSAVPAAATATGTSTALASATKPTALATTTTPAPTGTAATPSPGTPTPTPSRSADVGSLAASLADKVSAFKDAVARKDSGTMLRAQREMLEAADKAESALVNDHTRQADLVRSAVAAARGGAGGDTGKLEQALARLQEMGSLPSNTPAASPDSSKPSPNQAEIRTSAGSLESKARSFQDALKAQNTDDLLRLQRDLLAEIAKAEGVARDDSSRQAQNFRQAVSALKDAIASADAATIEKARTLLREAAAP